MDPLSLAAGVTTWFPLFPDNLSRPGGFADAVLFLWSVLQCMHLAFRFIGCYGTRMSVKYAFKVFSAYLWRLRAMSSLCGGDGQGCLVHISLEQSSGGLAALLDLLGLWLESRH